MTELERKVSVSWLFSFYGALLTERQQDMLRLYCEEDQSLSEIAGAMRVTRQCVHDTLRRGEEQLAEYEQKLGLYQRHMETRAKLCVCADKLEAHERKAGASPELTEARAIICDIISTEDQ